MKKILLSGRQKLPVIMLLILTILVIFSSCGSETIKPSDKSEEINPSDKSEEINPADKSEEINPADKSEDIKSADKEEAKALVSDFYAGEGEYKDEFNTNWSYSYHVPQLNIESDAAEAINEKIADVFSPLIEDQKKYEERKEAPQVPKVSWKSYENEDILSLVIKADTIWNDSSYLIYNYNLAENTECETEELLKAIGYDESSFEQDIKKAAVREFDRRSASYFSEFFDPANLERRAYTAANCYFYDSLFYYDGEKLHGIVLVGSLAGSDTVTADVVIENEPEVTEGSPDQCNYNFVWAMKKANNDIYVSFEKTQESEEFLKGSFADFGNYKVSGCLEKYEQMHMGSLSSYYFAPVLYLLTEDGLVEYVDIYSFINYGTLCCGNILTGVKDVVSFEDDESGDNRTVFAVTSSGEKIDLAKAVEDVKYSICSYYLGSGTADCNGRTVFLELASDFNTMKISSGNSEGLIDTKYWGSYSSLGMTETGQVIAYEYCNTMDVWHSGCFEILSVYSDYLSSEGNYIILKWISGDNPFGTEDILNFGRSMG